MAVRERVAVQRQGIEAPGPKGIPVIGSAIAMKRDLLGFMHRGMLEYGDVVKSVVGPPPIRVSAYGVFHPDGVQHVLASNADNYCKADEVYGEVRKLLGNGLLTSEGDVWKRQKRMVQPLFTHKQVASYVPMIENEARNLVERWSPSEQRGETVDLHSEMTRVTLRVVGRAVFGSDVDHMIPIFHDSVPFLSRRAFERGINPLAVPEDWPLPSNKKAQAYKDSIEKVVNDLIADRRRAATEGNDLVNLLLRAQDPEGGIGLSDEEVRDQALIFLMAGHETTATALTFTFHLLGYHADVQARVREEAQAVLSGGEFTMESIRGLGYTMQAVKEAMRLYPSAHAIPRSPIGDDVIMGYRIPAGSPVITSPWVTHRHPGFWDVPERFDPDRFTPAREAARHRYAYFPFGGGPRACIGQYFSMLEAVIVTAMVINAYDVATAERTVPLFLGITLRPAGEMPATLTRR
ncbi:MAG TPA: cytochrome P450 [Actinomycetota bacterium]|nr:cytochrome P450 [Actinomycetota bacterium]